MLIGNLWRTDDIQNIFIIIIIIEHRPNAHNFTISYVRYFVCCEV